MSVQGFFGEINAASFLLLLYFVHAFREHTDDEVRFHALRQAVADHGVCGHPLQLVSAIGILLPRFLPLIQPHSSRIRGYSVVRSPGVCH